MDVRHNNNALQELNDCIRGLLHLGLNVITFRTLLHLGPNVITFRTVITSRTSTWLTIIVLVNERVLESWHTLAIPNAVSILAQRLG